MKVLLLTLGGKSSAQAVEIEETRIGYFTIYNDHEASSFEYL